MAMFTPRRVSKPIALARARGGVPAALLALSLLALAPGEARSQEANVEPDGDGGVLDVTLEEAISRARLGNPGLQRVRNEEGPAEWELRSARGSLLPSVSTSFGMGWQGSGQQRIGAVTVGEGFADASSFLLSSYDVGLNLSVSGSTLLAPRRAEAQLGATRSRILAAERELELEVTRAYLEILRRHEGLRLAERELRRAEANLELAQARHAVGAATELEARQAQVEVGRARVNLTRGEAEARNAELLLFELMGEEPEGRELRLTSTFEVEPLEVDAAELYDLSLERNPGLAALRAQEEAAAHDVRAARSTYLPTLSLSAGWSGFTRQASNDEFLLSQAIGGAQGQIAQCQLFNEIFSRLADPLPPQDCSSFELTTDRRDALLSANRAFPFDFTRQPPSLFLTISLPIFQGLQRQRQVETARVARDNTRLQLRERRLAVRSEIARGLRTARAAYEAARLEEENRELAEEQVRLAREQFEVGMVDFLQLADAEAVKARADREHLAAVYSYHEAVAALEAVVGASLRDH